MRRICVVVNSRANYGRIKSFMRAAESSRHIELSVVVGASALLQKFGDVRKIIIEDGFSVSAEMYSVVEGNEPAAMAVSAGLATVQLSGILNSLAPEAVVVVADRYEQIATAISASYMNIPVAHLQGGELTGSIDDSVRHAITKLSHIHFPATALAGERLIKMGESPDQVHVIGCPSIDLSATATGDVALGVLSSGVGGQLEVDSPYIIVSQHSVTTEYQHAYEQVSETLSALVEVRNRTGVEVLWLWPNVDAGSDSVSRRLRKFRENEDSSGFHFYRNFSPEDYVRLMRKSKCIVGNSSSGIREASFLGVPSVNIGNRQNGRERGPNVIDVPNGSTLIQEAIFSQIHRGPYEPSFIYGDGKAGERMAEILSSAALQSSKSFYE